MVKQWSIVYLMLFRMSQNDPSVFVKEEIDFQKASVHRFFLHVPVDVTWAGEILKHHCFTCVTIIGATRDALDANKV